MRTIYQDGYSWIEIEDEVWKHATFVTYMEGIALDWFK